MTDMENFSVFSVLPSWKIRKISRFFLSFHIGNLENFLGFFRDGRKKLPLKGECVFLSKLTVTGKKMLGKGAPKSPLPSNNLFLPRDKAVFLQ